MRAEMIATPCDGMPVALIREYSNSAHGVPSNQDDLRALWPRYLELIAAGEEVDTLEIGVELSRFGQALASDAGVLSEAQAEAYADWGRCLLSAWPVRGSLMSHEAALLYPLQMLIVGGIAPEALLPRMDDLLRDPQRMAAFAEAVAYDLDAVGRLDLYALKQAGGAAQAAFLAWMKADAMRDRLKELATDPKAPWTAAEAGRIVAGRLEALHL
ncbi:MAG: hypothetical protein R3D85_17050 [Paracoccaceae bacterium]